MESLRTIERDGFKAKIYPDTDASNPFREWDQLGVMYIRGICASKETDKWRSWRDMPIESGMVAIIVHARGRGEGCFAGDTVKFRYDLAQGELVPSNIDPDDHIDGIIYASRAAIEKEYGKVTGAARRKAEKLLRLEVEQFNQYLEGDCYYMTVSKVDDDCDCADEMVDSCGGFYGYKYAQEEAERMLQYAIDSAREEAETLAKAESMEGAGI